MKLRLGFVATLLSILACCGTRQRIYAYCFNTKVSLGATEWYNPVTDQKYNNYKK